MVGLRSALLAGLLGTLAFAPALADDPAPEAVQPGPSPIEATFTNTVRITADDSVTLVYFNRDGTFTARGPKGDEFGTWKIENGKICTHTKGGGNSCGLLEPDRQVGDKWIQRIEGETFEIEILRGR